MDINTAVEQIRKIRGNPLLVLNLPEVDELCSHRLHDILLEKNFEQLDLILQTPGGDIDPAFKIVKMLRRATKKLNIIVPLFAKSAGTLICLGADQVLLSDLSELGPLDTQVMERQSEDSPRYRSALNEFKALEQIQLHSLDTFDKATLLILKKSGIKMDGAVRLAGEFAAKTCNALYAKLEPNVIGEFSRALDIVERYGIEILCRYLSWDRDLASHTVRSLVKDYPSHSYVIDLQELQKLRLPGFSLPPDQIKICELLGRLLVKEDKLVVNLFDSIIPVTFSTPITAVPAKGSLKIPSKSKNTKQSVSLN